MIRVEQHGLTMWSPPDNWSKATEMVAFNCLLFLPFPMVRVTQLGTTNRDPQRLWHVRPFRASLSPNK